MKLKDWMKENRWRCSEFEKVCGVDRTSLYYHNSHNKAFGKKRAERISKATGGVVTVFDLMFPELEIKILKNKDKKSQKEEKQRNYTTDENASKNLAAE